jgi:hypothetical protein
MNPKEIGTIGESIAITEFIKLGIQVYLPFGENSKVDFIVDIDNVLYKCQVKTTNTILNDKFQISLESTRSNKTSNTRVSYTNNDIDFYILVCLQNDFVGMLHIDEAPKTQINVNLERKPSRNQYRSWCIEDLDISSCVETLRDASRTDEEKVQTTNT